MATKKKKSTNKGKKVGALALKANSPLVMYGSIAVGYLMGDKVNQAIDKVAGDKIDSKIIAGGQVGLGALLVFKKGGKASTIKTVAGGVLLGAGVKRAMTAFGIGSINGYQSVAPVNGFQTVPAVGSGSRKRVGYANPGNGGMGWMPTHVSVGRNRRAA